MQFRVCAKRHYNKYLLMLCNQCDQNLYLRRFFMKRKIRSHFSFPILKLIITFRWSFMVNRNKITWLWLQRDKILKSSAGVNIFASAVSRMPSFSFLRASSCLRSFPRHFGWEFSPGCVTFENCWSNSPPQPITGWQWERERDTGWRNEGDRDHFEWMR